jgi:hypothetical protein
MTFIYLVCNQCNQDEEIKCDGDNPMYCPSCLALDDFREATNEDKERIGK